MKDQAEKGWWSAGALIIVLAITAGSLGWVIFTHRDYPFFFDEAIHANGGLSLAIDLWDGNLLGFLENAYSQGFYPPTFSILKALAYTIFGPSTAVARGFSLVCLLAALVVIYFFSQTLWIDLDDDSGVGGWGGLIAVLLTLTSLPLLNASTHVMMEAPGLLISFVFLWLYYRTFAVSTVDGTFARPADSDKRGFVLTSLVLMAVFLTKYTYGLAMVGTVGLMELSMLDWRSGAQLRRMGTPPLPAYLAPLRAGFSRWLWLIGPSVLCLALWLGTPFKIGEFFGYATAQPNEARWTWDALLFYPRNIALQQLPSPLFGAVSLIGLGWAMKRWDRPGVRLILIFFLVGMVEILLNFPKIPRFATTFLPAAHLLTGFMLVDRLAGQKRWDIERWTLVALVGTSLIWAVPVLTGRYSTFAPLMQSQLKTAPSVNEIPAWIDAQFPDDGRLYIVNYFELINAESLAWAMLADGEPRSGRFERYEMPATLLGAPTAENIEQFRQDVLESGVDFVLVIEGGDWGESWPPYDQQLGDLIEYHSHQDFRIEVVDRPTEILWTTIIDRSVADYVLEHERGAFNLKLLIYRVKG